MLQFAQHLFSYDSDRVAGDNVSSLAVQIPSWWSSSGFLHQQERFSMRIARISPINSVKERRQEAFTKN